MKYFVIENLSILGLEWVMFFFFNEIKLLYIDSVYIIFERND